MTADVQFLIHSIVKRAQSEYRPWLVIKQTKNGSDFGEGGEGEQAPLLPSN